MEENKDNTVNIKITDEMKGAYLAYGMSVIVGRALPDIRDGLKPVQRRVLYSMHEIGATHNKPYSKSARVVGDVIGKYHPHGDTAVYDTIVRLAQEFTLRNTLIDGQGNFGSIDGDPPAAMRYTEVRMEELAERLLDDLEKQTVDFQDNYDGRLKEPKVLPSRFPNLLINGSSGIAVGMSTNIPPHNLKEICDATIRLIEDPQTSDHDLLGIVKGPDFPTGATINGDKGFKEAYLSGRGMVYMKGVAEVEVQKNGRERIIITELPYQVNKANLIERIAEMVRDKKIEGISDLRDESDRNGMRIVVEVKKDFGGNVVLNNLYKQTALSSSFGIIMLAINNGRPEIMTLKKMLQAFILFRKEVVTRRTVFELRQAEAKAHVLEGLVTALGEIDRVISIIRGSRSPADAKNSLIAQIKLTEIQAQAILDLRLQRLTAMEVDKVKQELKEIKEEAARLKAILASDQKISDIIKNETIEIRDKFGSDRRTKVEAVGQEIDSEELIPVEDQVITLTNEGYIKRVDPDEYKAQKRGGKGLKGAVGNDTDFVTRIFFANSHESLMVITDQGKAYVTKVYRIPKATRTGKGRAIVNLLGLGAGEKVKAALMIKDFNQPLYIMMAAASGHIKKTELNEFSNVRNSGIKAIVIDEGDELIGAELTSGKDEVVLATKDGLGIRFNEEDVRPMGRASRGVWGIRPYEGDRVVGMQVVRGEAPVLIATSNGLAKRTALEEFRTQGRGGKGIIILKVTEKTGTLVGLKMVQPTDHVILVSDQGQTVRTRVSEIKEIGRYTQGVKVMDLKEGERIVAFESISQNAAEEDE